jgi:hypothetical protein
MASSTHQSLEMRMRFAEDSDTASPKSDILSALRKSELRFAAYKLEKKKLLECTLTGSPRLPDSLPCQLFCLLCKVNLSSSG